MIDAAFVLPRPPDRTRRVRFGSLELAAADLDAHDIAETIRSLEPPAGDVVRRARAIARVARRFRDPADPLRRATVEAVAATTGFSTAMVAEVLPAVFAPLEPDRLIDAATVSPTDLVRRVAIVSAGNVVGVALAKTALALTAGVACVVKPSAAEPACAVAFAAALVEEHDAFRSSHAVVWWPGGRADLERAAFAAVDALVAYGSDETIRTLARSSPPIFIGYGHRLSLGVVRAFQGEVKDLADAVARDVVLHDQQGCLSPQAIYVVGAREAWLERWIEALSSSLAALAEPLPRGRTDESVHVAIRRFRDAYEWRALRGEPVRIRHDPEGTAWTVVLDPEPALGVNPLHRTIVVRPVADLAVVERALGDARGRIESIGCAPWPDEEIVGWARALGVPRVVPLGSMQEPGLDWRQGGQPPLAGLLREADSGAR